MKLLLTSLFVTLFYFSSISLFAQAGEKDLTQGISVYLFNGYAAGYRFNECDNSFWRVNLDLYTNYTNLTDNSNGNSVFITNGDTNSYESKNEHNRLSLTLTPQYLIKFYENKFINIYSGAGILVGYIHEEYKMNSKRLGDYTHNDYQYTVSTGYSAGLIGILGAEAKLTENLSVFVESQLSGVRSWTNSSSNSSSVENGTEQYRNYSSEKDKGWTADFVISRAGIVIKF